jgi:hypothetical protein
VKPDDLRVWQLFHIKRTWYGKKVKRYTTWVLQYRDKNGAWNDVQVKEHQEYKA